MNLFKKTKINVKNIQCSMHFEKKEYDIKCKICILSVANQLAMELCKNNIWNQRKYDEWYAKYVII